MTNLERLRIEIKGVNYPDTELSIYLQENGLDPAALYNPQSNTNKRSIYLTALSVLESLANQPQLMKNYKEDDMTVSQFAENIQARIDQLERKIRSMRTDEQADSNFFMLFSE
ncbi:hypothetical protein BSNK01_00060 [Bacillaceae bacterium]